MGDDAAIIVDQKLEEWENGNRALIGLQIRSLSLELCELAGKLGFDCAWIEVEHGSADFETVEMLAMTCDAANMLSIVRVPDHSRHHILRALEAGARIVMVPMVNDAETAREIVRWGKFAPLGERGFNTSSRGLSYGIDGREETFARVNAHTHLIAHIETMEAVANVDEIAAVEGISGIFVGPGDLSASLGIPGQQGNPKLVETVIDIISRAKAAGHHAGILAHRPLTKVAMAAGADLAICGSDVTTLRDAWRALLADARNRFEG